MKKTTVFLIAILICALTGFISAPKAWCEPASVSAPENIEGAAAPDPDSKEFAPKQKDKDPFKVLLTPPPPVEPQGPSEKDRKIKTPVPAIEPLPIKVTFIVGSSYRKFATLCLNNKIYQMTNGESEDSGLFRIIEVLDREVKIFDSRINKERTLRLNE
ncbi:MAG TPA: hypothetical protein PKW98_09905 [Candidatus Wallbacteria bacterium]|nr:MAG: hypothetical protein BWY32_01508 [bacterium ADurb.Bin243]HPG58120.1 hypothetical protein [Candidatus Wallbacteria bacterium]